MFAIHGFSSHDNDLFADLRARGVIETALLLGLIVVGRALGPCPACGAECRGSSDRRPPIGITANGLGWKCHACGAKGDAVTLAALKLTGEVHPSRDGWRTVAESLG